MLGRGGGGVCRACFRPGPISVWGGRGFLVPKGNQPTACTLALWWLKFGPTECVWGGRGGGGRYGNHSSAEGEEEQRREAGGDRWGEGSEWSLSHSGAWGLPGGGRPLGPPVVSQ